MGVLCGPRDSMHMTEWFAERSLRGLEWWTKRSDAVSKVIYYLTCSLDGYIARSDGSVDWIPDATGADFGYAEFYATIGTVIQGRRTYEQVLTFGDYPYAGKKNVVFSTTLKHAEHAEVVDAPIGEFVATRREADEKDMWLVGGAQLAGRFFAERAIDELIVFVQPILLGEGIPLTGRLPKDVGMTLRASQTFPTGQVRLDYQVV